MVSGVVDPHAWDQCPYKRDPPGGSLFHVRPCEATATTFYYQRSRPSPATPTSLVPWSLTSQLPELWAINVCCLKATWSAVLFVTVARTDWGKNIIILEMFYKKLREHYCGQGWLNRLKVLSWARGQFIHAIHLAQCFARVPRSCLVETCNKKRTRWQWCNRDLRLPLGDWDPHMVPLTKSHERRGSHWISWITWYLQHFMLLPTYTS